MTASRRPGTLQQDGSETGSPGNPRRRLATLTHSRKDSPAYAGVRSRSTIHLEGFNGGACDDGDQTPGWGHKHATTPTVIHAQSPTAPARPLALPPRAQPLSFSLPPPAICPLRSKAAPCDNPGLHTHMGGGEERKAAMVARHKHRADASKWRAAVPSIVPCATQLSAWQGHGDSGAAASGTAGGPQEGDWRDERLQGTHNPKPRERRVGAGMPGARQAHRVLAFSLPIPSSVPGLCAAQTRNALPPLGPRHPPPAMYKWTLAPGAVHALQEAYHTQKSILAGSWRSRSKIVHRGLHLSAHSCAVPPTLIQGATGSPTRSQSGALCRRDVRGGAADEGT